MSDLRSSNIFDALDEDAPTTSTAPAKKDAKAGAEKPSSKKVDAPHKKEKQPKSEEPAAPLGKESRGVGGRDQKPRGRGRDNKGGLRRPAGSGREFDRRSGPSATHRNPREGKRGDHGRYNWGNEIEEANAAKTDEATPASPPPQADNENKAETGAAAEAGAENKDAAAPADNKAEDAEPAKKEEDEDDKKITFDQYLKNKEAAAPAGDKLTARAVEIDEEKWKGTPVVSNKKKTAKKQDSEEDDDDKKEKSKKKNQKNTVTWFEFVGSQGPARPAPREPRDRPPRTDSGDRPARGGAAAAGAEGGRGRGRGRGTGRGASRGGGRGGPRAPRGSAPALDDTAFPKLGAGK